MGRKVKRIKQSQGIAVPRGFKIATATKKGRHQEFWNNEYKTSEHLALSMNPSEDLEKFTRWMEREYGREFLNPIAKALDIGTGNGRNLIYLSEQYGMRGFGFDVSEVAIAEARKNSVDLPLEFEVRSMSEALPLEDSTITLVLDMMSSHFMKEAERAALLEEVVRVLKPGGWLFFKSFLADEDLHTKRLLKENPADEKGAYIHPELGVYEYVWSESVAREFFEPYFEIHKFQKSHKHIHQGKIGDERAWKRRTFSAYLQKR